MAKVLQHRRGTATEHSNFTGAAGEITYDTTDKRLVVHDGATKGGIPLALESEVVAAQTTATNAATAASNAQATANSASTAAANAASAASTAQSTANTASSTATSAQTTANNALPKSGGTISGSLTVTGTLKGGTIQATSDARLKEDFAPITSAIDRLCKLDAFTYSFKSDTNHERHAGLIAQQVKDVLPEAVKEDENGYLSIDYNGIIAMLVQAIREMNNQNKEH